MSLLNCGDTSNQYPIRKGILDIPSSWDGKPIQLKGEWLALDGIRNYEDFLDHYQDTYTVQLPATGKEFTGIPEKKAISLFLHIDIGKGINPYETLSIFTSKIWTAHRVLVNGHTILEVGSVGDSENSHIPKVKPSMGTFPYTKSMDIVIQVSNFTHNEYGIRLPPQLGESSGMYNFIYRNKLYDIVFMLVLFLFVCINLGIYISNSQDKSPLAYSLLLIIFIFLIPITAASERILWDVFPNLSFTFITGMEGFLILSVTPVYLYFLKLSFPRETKTTFIQYYFMIKIPVIVLLVFSVQYSHFFHTILKITLFFDFGIASFSFYFMIRAIQNHRPQANLIFYGFLCVFITLIVDVLFEYGLGSIHNITIYGFMITFFMHSTALVLRVRKTYFENEHLANKLIHANEYLELRVEERTMALREAMEQTKEANQLKDRFISIVSHDIRSPLSGVSSLIGMILRDSSLEKEEIYNLLSTSRKTLQSLTKMTEEILSYSKNQKIHLLPKFEVVRIRSIIEEVLNKFQILLDEKKLECIVDGDSNENVLVDPSLTGIAITNFISNSIKFSNNGGNINIQYYSEKNKIILKIKDSGVGIPNSKLDTLFDYERNQSTLGTKGERGTGFGMPFSKEILDSMQADISIESGSNQGTVVCVEFPKKNLYGLILDDNPNYRLKIKKMIQELNLDIFIIEKEDGESALEQLKVLPIGFIFTDYQMPGMNGLDFSYRALDMTPDRDLRIAIITSFSEKEEKSLRDIEEKAQTIGVNMVLSKTMPDDTLKSAIQILLWSGENKSIT